MARIELKMPRLGESIIEATILKWTVEPGGEVEADEAVLEIATDKVDSEVPAPEDGILIETFFNEGDVVPVDTVIAIIETESAAAGSEEPVSSNGHSQAETAKVEPVAVEAPQPVLAGGGPAPAQDLALQSRSEKGRFYSPLVLNIARTEGVSMTELEQIAGSGNGGRVTKKDILAYLKGPRITAPAPQPVAKTAAPVAQPAPQVAKAAPAAQTAPAGGIHIPAKTYSHSGQYDIIEMDRMRKMIAENMVYSKHVSAHVTSFVEADVTNVVMWRNQVKKEFQEKYGEKLTYTPLFIEAVAKALQEHPMVNVSVDGTNILVKKDINIGVAVALPNDNLIVPVIRHADRLNLLGLTAAVNDLAARARENKLKPDELEGGTYTVSNVGTFGNVMGTPVILQPQVAILATGAIRKKPAVIETPQGDFIGVRQMMFLSHSYDHRVVDGALGGRFVKRVGDILEAFNMDREI